MNARRVGYPLVDFPPRGPCRTVADESDASSDEERHECRAPGGISSPEPTGDECEGERKQRILRNTMARRRSTAVARATPIMTAWSVGDPWRNVTTPAPRGRRYPD